MALDGLKEVGELLDRSTVGIVITDPNLPDNPIVYVNQGFVDITGYSRSYAQGRNCRFLQGEKTHREDVTRMKRAIDDGEDLGIRLTNYKADGTPFCMQLLISPVEDEDGNVTAFFGVQREVSGDDNAGTGGGARPDHKTPSTIMLRELQHRVKNHLAMIVSLIRMHSARDLTKESFDALAHRVEALALLYDALLLPGDEDQSDSVAGGAYLSQVATTIGNISGRPDIRIKIDCDAMRLSVDAAGRLGLLLTEFLSNTFEHAFRGRSGGLVIVRFEEAGNRTARLIVQDDGVGLPEGSNWPEGSASIADQQSKAKSEEGELDTTSGARNSGLGGSIVRGLTKALGAELDVKSGESGTTITVLLNNRAIPSDE